MRIDSSTIGMESARSYTSTATQSFRFTITSGQLALGNQTVGSNAEDAAQEAGKENSSEGSYTEALSERMEEMRAKFNGFTSRLGAAGSVSSRDQWSQLATIRQQCIAFLFQTLFRDPIGQRNNVMGGNTGSSNAETSQGNMFKEVTAIPLNMRVLQAERIYSYSETETTAFSTQGKVVCADGREIDFNMNLHMSRSFQEYYQENYTMVAFNACDPLVINLDGNIAGMSDQNFMFDIDGDGELDNISRLRAGSGYLALDANGDGKINDGSELFGTKSGNGFADLAKYDTDGNGWIDEGDEIWDKLKIWVMDEDGNSQLYGLAEKGLGAICLSNASTDFTLADADNAARGMIRKSGVFLYESGAVGSIQHVDVVKYDHVS